MLAANVLTIDTQEDLDRALAMGVTPELRAALHAEFGTSAIRSLGREIARLSATQIQDNTHEKTDEVAREYA